MHADTRTYNAALAPADRKTCELLAKEIERALPDAENKVWHAHPVWFLDGNPIVGYSRLKDAVRLLFWSGQSFTEKGLRKEGSFKAAEARYTSAGEVDTEKLRRWLAEARVVQWDYKNIVRRKGRLVRLKDAASAASPAPKRKAPASPSPERDERPPAKRGTAPRAATGGSPSAGHRIFRTSVASVYPHYVAKAERNGRTKAEVDRIVCWLTGYGEKQLRQQLEKGTDFETFFAKAPALHPNAALITGVVCGVRVEEVEDPLMRTIRQLDKLIDELAKGRTMEKILRS